MILLRHNYQVANLTNYAMTFPTESGLIRVWPSMIIKGEEGFNWALSRLLIGVLAKSKLGYQRSNQPLAR
jgi:hypothetical protein